MPGFEVITFHGENAVTFKALADLNGVTSSRYFDESLQLSLYLAQFAQQTVDADTEDKARVLFQGEDDVIRSFCIESFGQERLVEYSGHEIEGIDDPFEDQEVNLRIRPVLYRQLGLYARFFGVAEESFVNNGIFYRQQLQMTQDAGKYAGVEPGGDKALVPIEIDFEQGLRQS